jgi:hypothetical protein
VRGNRRHRGARPGSRASCLFVSAQVQITVQGEEISSQARPATTIEYLVWWQAHWSVTVAGRMGCEACRVGEGTGSSVVPVLLIPESMQNVTPQASSVAIRSTATARAIHHCSRRERGYLHLIGPTRIEARRSPKLPMVDSGEGGRSVEGR